MGHPATSLSSELHLHYRCDFEVRCELARSDIVGALIREVRQWLTDSREIPKQAVAGAWFFNEGEWRSQGKDRSSIRTSQFDFGHGNQSAWTIRYEHLSESKFEAKSKADKFRVWRTDIAVNSNSGDAVRFSLQTAHYLQGSYFGLEPAEPEPNSPKIIKNIIQSDKLVTFSGTEPLLATPIRIAPADAELLWRRINDPERGCPLVYLSREFQSNETVVNAEKLAWGLAGLAAIYVADSSWVDKATEVALPENYRCWNGKVRVYLPRVGALKLDDFKRHRFFTPEQLRELGDAEFQRHLTRSLARKLLFTFDSRPKTIDDLRLVKQQAHLKSLTQRAGETASLEEMVSILNELNFELEEKTGQQERQLRGAEDRIEALESTQQEIQAKLAAAEYQAESARKQGAAATKSAQQLQKELAVYKGLKNLPQSISDCAEFFGKAFSGKLVFSERGLQSARKADYSDVAGYWRAMSAMASDLYQLFFENDGDVGDVEKKFRELTGIEMSMTEGSQTKADTRLMKKRQDIYHGEKIDITPHIKLHSGNKHFRIYFGILRSDKLLMIGECTDHMETAGSRRRTR